VITRNDHGSITNFLNSMRLGSKEPLERVPKRR
jgi:hypothetical protein